MNRLLSIKNLFLFATIVLLPILVTYYSINNMIEEQYSSKCESLAHELRQQVARIESTYTDEYQIKDFFSILMKEKKICRQKPEVIKEFIEKTDKLYPDAFKWVFLDENYKLLPINSKHILSGSKFWQELLECGVYIDNRLKEEKPVNEENEYVKRFYKSGRFIQKWLGESIKFEHVFQYNDVVHKAKWMKKDCFIVWNYDGISYNEFSVPTKIAGVCALVIFPDKLPEDIWLKRLIVRRKTSSDNYKFPIAAVNISKNISFALDSELQQNETFSNNLIKSYNKRANDIFEFSNYLVGTSLTSDNSEIRILSLADISDSLANKSFMQLMLKIACTSLFIISILLVIYIKNIHFAIISLRQRIAVIFIIAMILPIISLISIGKTFITHEENRLKESAYVKMRSSIEALSLRYRDIPRLIEVDLFNKLNDKFKKPPFTVESVGTNMQKAVDEKIINQYILFDENGIVSTSWKSIGPAYKITLKYMAKKFIQVENLENQSNKDNQLDAVISENVDEIETVLASASGEEFNFSRPSHLRLFVGLDTNLYFMAIKVFLDSKVFPLFVYLSDLSVEKNFAQHEFSTNNIAVQSLPNSIIIPELSFFATKEGMESYPKESPIWKKLSKVLNRSASLKIEEIGKVTIEGENFLYLTKPIYSMQSKSYQPFLLTSSKPIDLKIRDTKILLILLSSFALVGSVVLSFILSSSLLVPIKKIDDAAQQIGKGNLNITLPEEGKDELGRLSMTFNAMVEGLRERARMRAYVSDSVLEAVKDNSDQSVHAGKNIEATILFSDIRNFTGISEANTPKRVFEVLNEFLGGVEPIIHANHGRVDKFIGDAVMAIFHHTEPEHHAVSAIKAAVKMKAFVAEMNKDRKARGLFPIEIGIGISTGLVLLGDVGSRYRKDLTVIGDEVNLASRLETASKQGRYSKIIFSGQTLKFIEDLVEADKMPFEEIRGKKNAVQIFEFIKFKNQQ